VAAAIIAAHHIVLYGPVSDPGMALTPVLIDGLWLHGRYAVQVFLVISGFVTAYSLSRATVGPKGFAKFTARRYVRLGLPYLATVLGVLALENLTPPSFAAFPLAEPDGWRHVLAQAVFLQDILGYGNFSAGLWYVSIDFQFGLLFYLLLLLHAGLSRLLSLHSPRRDSTLLLALAVPLAVASVFIWNLDSAHAVGVHYFLGSLFIGVLAAWSLSGRVPRWAFWLYVAVVAVGLRFHWRERLALALVTGILVYVFARRGVELNWKVLAPVRALGRISYSFFLIHYPVHWVVSGMYLRFSDASPSASLLWASFSFLTSLIAAVVMYFTVERPSLRLANRLR
jgi:peptidoglycan/LPS O-acetylase OafA/YrhL